MDIMEIVFKLMLLTGFCQAQSIITAPGNATGIVGGDVKFICELEDWAIQTVTWEFNTEIVYSFLHGEEDHPKGCTKYKVIKDKKTFTLIVRNLAITDGGEYACLAVTAKAVASLIVLDQPKVFTHESSHKEGTVVTYSCEAHFGGPSKLSSQNYPQLRMYLDGDDLEGNIKQEISNFSNVYWLTELQNMTLSPEMNKKNFTCEIRTRKPELASSSCSEVEVLYSARNVGFSPNHEQYKVGQMINCTADGNPPPVVQWQNHENPDNLIEQEILHITKDMLGNNVWSCNATNTVDGEEYRKLVTIMFKAVSEEEYRSFVADAQIAYSSKDSTIRGNWRIIVAVTVPICIVLIVAICGTVVFSCLIALCCTKQFHAPTWYTAASKGNPVQPTTMTTICEKGKSNEECYKIVHQNIFLFVPKARSCHDISGIQPEEIIEEHEQTNRWKSMVDISYSSAYC